MNNPYFKDFVRLALLSLSLFLTLSLHLKAQQPPTVNGWTCPDPITGQPNTPYGNLTDVNGVRGMYVDEFMPPYFNESKTGNHAGHYDEFRVDFYSGILGNQEKEDRLIWYAKQHGINYLALYQTDLIFRFSNVPDSTYVYDPVREFYKEALNKFLLKCHLTDIEVGLVFEPRFLEWAENVPLPKNEFQRKQPSEGNSRSTTLKSGESLPNYQYYGVSISTQKIVDEMGGDTLYPGWDSLRVLMDSYPNAEFTINHDIYALANILKFQKNAGAQAISLFGQDSLFPFLCPECPDPPTIDDFTGLTSLVTEYEWWHSPFTTILKRGDGGVFDDFIDYLRILNSFTTHPSSNLELHHYQGPFPTTSTQNGYYARKEDIQPTDIGYYYNWIYQIVYFCDRIMLTNYYEDDLFLLDTSRQMQVLLPIFNEAANDSSTIAENRGSGKTTEIAVMFSAESPDFVSHGGFKKEHVWGRSLNTGISQGGESIYSLEKRFADAWVDNVNFDSNMVFVGSQWFTYSVMPHMVYSTKFASIDKYRNYYVSRSDSMSYPGEFLTGRRFDYYPWNSPGADITLQVYNPARVLYSSPGSVPDPTSNGNDYEWYYNANLGQLNTEVNLGVGTPYHFINATQQGHYYVRTTDAEGCPSTSLPVLVRFIDDGAYIKDNVDDIGNMPNTTLPSNTYIWETPDIVVNTSPFYQLDQRHRTIRTGYPNYVHVTVSNKSNQAIPANSLRLELYYTSATSAHEWPRNFVNYRSDEYNDTLYDSPKQYHDSTYVLGDRITLEPQYLDKEIPANGKETFSVLWDHRQTPYRDSLLGDRNDDSRNYYVLARLIRGEHAYNYGMHADENVAETNNTLENAYAFNAVAIKQLQVLTDSGKFVFTGSTDPVVGLDSNLNTNSGSNIRTTAYMPQPNSSIRFHQSKMFLQNIGNDHQEVGINFTGKDGSLEKLLGEGYLLIDIGPELFIQWQENGEQGNGIRPLVSDSLNDAIAMLLDSLFPGYDSLTTLLQVIDTNAWLGGLEMMAGQKELVKVYFKVSEGQFESERYQFSLVQFLGGKLDSIVGGQTFDLDFRYCQPATVTSATVLGQTNLFAHSQYFSPVSSFVWYSNRDSIPREIAQGAVLQGVSSGDYFLEVTYENGCKERTYVNVSKADETNQLVKNENKEVEVVTWIDENKQRNNLDVFPNPTTEILYVKTNTKVDQATILIVNSLGQLIYKQAADQAQMENTIDVSFLSSGVYQVVWSSSQGSFSKSFIKQ